MRYLIIAPDYVETCIKDEFNGYIDYEELGIPQDFIEEINSWHLSYRQIIPLSMEERTKKTEDIERLDTQGLSIARKLMKKINEPIKVKYFSEGKLKYIFFD